MAASEDTLLYLLLVNGAGFLLMGFDKMTAKLGSSRIPEFWFFLLSLAGGVMGVVAGMFAFHHKTSFQIKIAAAMVLVLPILVYFGVWVKKAPMLAWGMNSPVSGLVR